MKQLRALLAAKEISMDATIVTVLSELNDIFAFKEKQKKHHWKLFFVKKNNFALWPAGFGKNLVS